MHIFTVLQQSAAILRLPKGVFKQVNLYTRINDETSDNEVYAAHSGGFIRLSAKGVTSHPDITWEDLDGGGAEVRVGKNWGRLIV